MKKIIIVVGARPNFMKAAPIINELKKRKSVRFYLIHTGQHYDINMSETFFKTLNIPKPYANLNVGSGSHTEQTAEIMKRFEKTVIEIRPNVVVVVGDVNSTIACGLVSVKMGIKLAHVEAGLRSFDRTMPEEINRVLTDSISDYLFTTCRDADENLKREGIRKKKIYFVGNTMIDTLMKYVNIAKKTDIAGQLGLKQKEFCVATIHRPSNVDSAGSLKKIMKLLMDISSTIKVVFPMHPRTFSMLEKYGMINDIMNMGNLLVIEPLDYVSFISLMMGSRFVLTDSGGIQEETTVLNIPCITMRENTERPITCNMGTNRLVGNNPDRVLREVKSVLKRVSAGKPKMPPLWDGKSARRIVRALLK